MNPNNVVGTPDMQTQPVAPVASVAPVSQPEPNPMVAAMPEKKSSKGGIIAAILFAVLAAGGIGFGVYTMMNSKTQEDALNDQIATLKKQNAELMEQVTGDGEDGGSTINAEDYIYVDGLGIKIKKPENWREMIKKYSYSNEYPQGVDVFEIRESLDLGDGVSISVVNTSCDEEVTTRRVCFAVDDMNIIVAQLVGELVSVDDSTVSEIFWNHFSNPENYSAI